MGALLLPRGVIDALDARRRAFLWAGEEAVSGTQCLVNWGQSSAHLIAGCPFSVGFWLRIGVSISDDDVSRLWDIRAPSGVLVLHFNMFLLLCC
ncbi:hypothetical protein PR202_ga14319 [Eleusine coracana subsp. coracana]|uniref:Uncharacterized protein n=1 Tax=Eleusine coracana subsp. coracana TaxID=191504 RepID=A0AAV5CGX9_ELECO|nr:hypothetical protein PR202_ga14319 [Eleusine coracana subsp. coracana]